MKINRFLVRGQYFMNVKRLLKNILSCSVAAALILGVSSCGGSSDAGGGMSGSTTNLMSGVKAVPVSNSVEVDSAFVTQYNNFAFSLFKRTAFNEAAESSNQDKSFMISPLSVMSALSMTANGADGETLAQIQKLLGGLDPDELNRYMSAYAAKLPSGEKAKLSMADSIWLREGKVKAKDEFLKTNAAYYNADIYSSKFDRSTLDDINGWVSDNTDGMIEKMIDDIPTDAAIYLINALAFDAEWQDIYTEDKIVEGEFNGTLGKQRADMMCSSESGYLNDGKAEGFIKPYASGYSFVAMMPYDDISIDEYIGSLDGSKLMSLINNVDNTAVDVWIPKFELEYDAELRDVLRQLGMTDAFDAQKADFSRLGNATGGEKLYIGAVRHKTFMRVDERGTKAGAATSVEMTFGIRCGVMNRIVYLNRPFVCMVIENQTKTPVFIGAVMNIG